MIFFSNRQQSITVNSAEDIALPESSPLQQIRDPLYEAKRVEVWLKRDDLLHTYVQGNKWRKLKYNLREAWRQKHTTLISFGGYHSNHIYALAAAAKMFGFRSIGVIRGERPAHPGFTLNFAEQCGMHLHYVTRTAYSEKYSEAFIRNLHEEYGRFYLIPEGGTNTLALEGVVELVKEITIPYRYLCTACGTGGTLSGLAAALPSGATAIGFSSLKGDNILPETVRQLLHSAGKSSGDFTVNTDFTLGGYAKCPEELQKFILEFNVNHDIVLDPVYTAKMMYGLHHLILEDYFKPGDTIVAIHTGGLQGIYGYPQLVNDLRIGV